MGNSDINLADLHGSDDNLPKRTKIVVLANQSSDVQSKMETVLLTNSKPTDDVHETMSTVPKGESLSTTSFLNKATEEKCPINRNPQITPPIRIEYSQNPAIHYVPMKYSDTDMCVESWIRQRELGRGCFGSVFQACKSDNECNYVLKVSDISNQHRYEMFQRDQHFLFLLNGKGIAPEIYDAYVCNEFGHVVMDKWDGDVKSTELWRYGSDGLMYVQEWVWLQMIDCLVKLSAMKILHGDVKEDNFLVKVAERKLCLADFGTAIDYSKEVITDPNMVKMGWHLNRWGCRTQKDFTELYNLWNLELRVRSLIKGNNTDALHIVRDDGSTYPFTKFDNIPEQIRAGLDSTCVILKYAKLK
jgi:hypothetical protein